MSSDGESEPPTDEDASSSDADDDCEEEEEDASPSASEASEDEAEDSDAPKKKPATKRAAPAPERGAAAAPRGRAAAAGAPVPRTAPVAAVPAALRALAAPAGPNLAPLPAPPASRPAPQRAARPAARRVADSDGDGEDDDDDDDSSGGDGGDSDSEASFEVPGGSDSDAEDDPALAFATAQARKAANVKAMLTGQLTVQRAPLLPRLLTLTDAQEALRKPFKPPVAGSTATGPSGALLARSLCLCVYPGSVCVDSRALCVSVCAVLHTLRPDYKLTDELRAKLAMQRAFVPWGSKGVQIKLPTAPPASSAGASDEALPTGVEPLQLWPLEGDALPEGAQPILVDNMLVKWLRPHQREGCVSLARSVCLNDPYTHAITRACERAVCNSCSSASPTCVSLVARDASWQTTWCVAEMCSLQVFISPRTPTFTRLLSVSRRAWARRCRPSR